MTVGTCTVWRERRKKPATVWGSWLQGDWLGIGVVGMDGWESLSGGGVVFPRSVPGRIGELPGGRLARSGVLPGGYRPMNSGVIPGVRIRVRLVGRCIPGRSGYRDGL